jgi:methyl-accepting chemotaxis protein
VTVPRVGQRRSHGVSRLRQKMINITLVEEITSASIEQDTGADQINMAIQQLNDVTQENAATAEEMATSAEELYSHAEHLKELISFFTI